VNTSGNLIKLDKGDLENYRRQKSFIDAWNQKMVILRQKQIYNALNQATKTKIDFFQKVSKWMNMLEGKIFNQQVIDQMDLNKAISLIKFVSNVSLKLMAQMNDMEEIFKAYVDLNSKVPEVQGPKRDESDLSEIKKGLYEILSGSMKDNSTTVTPNTESIIVPKEEVKFEDEKEKSDILVNSELKIPELMPEKENKKGEPEGSPDDIQDIDVNLD
jgi:hypothetical protein